MCEAKPAAIASVRIDQGAAAADQAAAIKLAGVKDSEGFFKHQLFIAGLKEDIHMKIMEAGKPSIQESIAHPHELKVIHEDRKKGSLWATSEPKTTMTTTLTMRNVLPSTQSVFKEVDSHIVDQGNSQATKANNLAQQVLDKDNKANNNSSPSPANAGTAKSRVIIIRTVAKEKQLKPQRSTGTANLTPTRSRHSNSLSSNRTTTGAPPPSPPHRLTLII
jgi:hypothetical protein